eukprot:NODE_624_length_5307_cov_0.437980.p1 type:complete len:510 gc:universal NODE_624_length_5307_cov_0.437980:242-1771(+)
MGGRSPNSNKIKPTMTVYNGIALVATMMIGSGIFVTPGLIVAKIGSIGTVLFLWVLTAFISFCGANTFVEWGMLFPKSGGSLSYLAYAYKKPKYLASFIYCLTQVGIIWPAMITAEADASSKQLLYNVTDLEPWMVKVSSAVLVTIIVLINYFSVEFALKLSTGLTYLKIYTLYALCIAGIFAYCGISSKPMAESVDYVGTPSTKPADYASAIYKLLWVFDGWNNLNYAIEEMKNPARDFPRSVYFGFGITTVLYILTNFFFITIVPYDQILSSKTSIATVYATIIFGDFVGGKMVPFIIFLGCYATTDNMVYGVSRIIHASASSNILPWSRTFEKLDTKRGTPRNALIYVWCICMALIAIPLSEDAFSFFLQMAMYPKWIFYGMVISGLLYLRYKEPFLNRPVKSYLFSGITIVIASVFLAIFPLLGSDMIPSVASLLVIFLSAMIYFARRKKVEEADFGFHDTANLKEHKSALENTIYTEMGSSDYEFVKEFANARSTVATTVATAE